MTTSTKDDRVHPYHARSFVKRPGARRAGRALRENIEGGHGGAADAKQRAWLRSTRHPYFARSAETQKCGVPSRHYEFQLV